MRGPVSSQMNAIDMLTKQPSTSITVKKLFLGSLQAICIVCGLLQFYIDSSYDNLIPAVLATATTTLMLQYLRASDSMTTHPVSSLALLGFTVSSQFAAMVTQSLDGEPFTRMLRAPLLTFSILGSVHVLAIGTHWVYRHFKPFDGTSRFIAERVVSPIGGHTIPPVGVIWVMGLFGLVSMAMGVGQFGDVSGKSTLR